MQPTLDQKNIELEIILMDTELMLDIDPSLIDQVLINLLVNSIEAVKEKPDARLCCPPTFLQTEKS
jgi:C4-dicarboxylate-specific signal transduction histidine kinase